jgi:hypothetical protein
MLVIRPTTLASSLGSQGVKSKENYSIVFVSKDNKSFVISLVSSIAIPDATILPGSVRLTDSIPENFKVICKIISSQNMSEHAFKELTTCKVIANSLDDRLKAYTFLRELERCL